MQEYTLTYVSEHNTPNAMWIVIDGNVYNVSQYLDEHPGGEEIIAEYAGLDASEAFEDIGHSDEAHDILKTLLIGKVRASKTLKEKSQYLEPIIVKKAITKPRAQLPLRTKILLYVAPICFLGFLLYRFKRKL